VPVFNASDANITYSRACSAVAFHWSAVLGGSLPRFIDGIVAVLHSPEGRMFTFSVSGRSVKTVGHGDLHRGLSGNLASLGRRLNVTAAGSEWSLTLYPTEALQRQYMTSKPRNNALGIGATMLATALLFIYYELFDRRRTARVHARLLAYVHQLEAMQRALADGCAREAEAKARVLAEEASSRQKDQFVAMVSHEIRTPLNAVGGATALLGGTPLNEEQRELVALLEAGCAHVILIVEDILLHGSLVSGAFSVARERVALSRAVLDPAWRMVAMQPAARAKLASLRLSRSVAEDVPPVILVDATRLTQVIVNLLSNGAFARIMDVACALLTSALSILFPALKFTPAGGAVELLVDVTSDPPVAAAQDGASSPKEEQQRWLRFRVRDTGIGVSPEQLQRIFEVRHGCRNPPVHCSCPHAIHSLPPTSHLCRRSSPRCAASAARAWGSQSAVAWRALWAAIWLPRAQAMALARRSPSPFRCSCLASPRRRPRHAWKSRRCGPRRRPMAPGQIRRRGWSCLRSRRTSRRRSWPGLSRLCRCCRRPRCRLR
jgi:signal transduction histidine kinase